MIISINDEAISLDAPCTLQELLLKREIYSEHMAVAINTQFVPKSQFSSRILHDNDSIDLIVPMQGG